MIDAAVNTILRSTAVQDSLYLLDDALIFTCTRYCGEVKSPFAGSIVIADEQGDAEVRTAGQVYRQTHLAIRPGVKHSVSFDRGNHIYVRISPTHPLFRRICAIPSPGAIALDGEAFAAFRAELLAASFGELDRMRAEELANSIARTTARHLQPVRTADARVARVIKILQQQPECTGEELSAVFGVSICRLSHMFRESAGLPIKTYRRWLRLHNATAQLASGRPLTSIAQSGGYADLSHFGREFRETAGVAPSVLFQSDKVRVFHWRNPPSYSSTARTSYSDMNITRGERHDHLR